MASQRTTGLTYDDLLEMFPEDDGVRRELIGGELIVAPSPSTRHQRVVVKLVVLLHAYADEHGGEVLTAPYDVKFTEVDVVEPDVLFVTQDHLDRFKERFIDSAPDVVVEVSSPSTRHLELVRKRDLYEREGVPEYWYVDLDAERVEVHRLAQGGYGSPEILIAGAVLESPLLPGLRLPVDEVLAPPAPPSD